MHRSATSKMKIELPCFSTAAERQLRMSVATLRTPQVADFQVVLCLAAVGVPAAQHVVDPGIRVVGVMGGMRAVHGDHVGYAGGPIAPGIVGGDDHALGRGDLEGRVADELDRHRRRVVGGLAAGVAAGAAAGAGLGGRLVDHRGHRQPVGRVLDEGEALAGFSRRPGARETDPCHKRDPQGGRANASRDTSYTFDDGCAKRHRVLPDADESGSGGPEPAWHRPIAAVVWHREAEGGSRNLSTTGRRAVRLGQSRRKRPGRPTGRPGLTRDV